MKNNKGITLIALVITIIVLLILAGVAIAMLTGENSILKRASDSRYVNEIAAAKDEVSLAIAEGIANYYEGKYVATEATKDGVLKFVHTEVSKVTSNTYVKVTKTPDTWPTGEGTTAPTEVVVRLESQEDNTIYSQATIDATGAVTWENNFKSTK